MAVASNVVLAPVTIWYFGVFPPNFLLNMPWLPVQGLVVQVLGMVGMALATVPFGDALATMLLHAAAWVQQGMLDLLHAVAVQGWLPVWTLLRPRWPEMLGAGMIFCLVPAYWRRPEQAPWAFVAAGLLLVATPHALLLRQEAKDEVRLSLIDVGQAQAVLLDLPGGRRILVDGGGSMSPNFDLGRSVVSPFLTWGRPPRLDAIFLSHPDSDHAQGLVYLLRQYQVQAFYTNGQWPAGELGAALGNAITNRGIQPQPLAAGQSVWFDGDVQVQVLHPDPEYASKKTNEMSLVLRVLWRGEPLVLLPGDVQRGGIEDMVDRKRDLRAQVLVLPHHGSKSSLSGMLYEGVNPRQALVSCGFQNMFQFPNSAVVEALGSYGIPLESTAERGLLELVWEEPEGPFRLSGQAR
jgi:competence protein ComEC